MPHHEGDNLMPVAAMVKFSRFYSSQAVKTINFESKMENMVSFKAIFMRINDRLDLYLEY